MEKLRRAIITAGRSFSTQSGEFAFLRPYQQECIDVCLENFQRGITRQVVSLPVGSGKTVVFSNMIRRLTPRKPGADKILVCAHREELLHQAARQIMRHAPGLKIDLDQGKNKAQVRDSDVIIASVPTLGRKGSSRLAEYDPDLFNCIIIDEAHHAAALSYRRILAHFGSDTPAVHTGPRIWGCSATLRRHDHAQLDGVFDHIAYHKGFVEMIREGWLCGLRVFTVKTPRIADQAVRAIGIAGDGDFRIGQLAQAVNSPERNKVVVHAYMTHVAARCKSTLVFAVNVAHVRDLTVAFQLRGIDARAIVGTTETVERHATLDAFRRQEFPVLINCGILTEGTDIPVIDAVLLARPTRSQSLLQQMIGRGMRLAAGKRDCLVVDFVDNLNEDRGGVCTAPTLFGLAWDKELLDANVETMQALEEDQKKADEAAAACRDADEATVRKLLHGLTIDEHDDPLSLLVSDATNERVNIRKLSRNNWLRVGSNAFLLSLPDGSIRIQTASDVGGGMESIKIALRRRSTKNTHAVYELPMPSICASNIVDALRLSDAWVRQQYGHIPNAVEWSAPWRKLPATLAQLALLKKRGVLDMMKDGDHGVIQARLTKGKASDLLAKSFEGALNREHQMEI